MELREYARVLRRQWLLIALFTVIGLGLAIGLTAITTKVYSARSSEVVTAPIGDATVAGTNINASSQFVLGQIKTFVGLSDSELVLNPVIEELGLNTTVTKLSKKVTISNPVDTTSLNIDVTDSDKAKARDISNSVATHLKTVIEQLEVEAGSTKSQVAVTITKTAVLPTSPVSPKPVLNYALGLVIGLVIGVAVAMIRERMDNSVTSAEQVRAISGASPLGSVGFSAEIAKTPLVALTPRTPLAEAYRTIRTRLQFVDVDNPPRRIVITSSVPSEGKTVSACNLAITIANTGAKVCLVEGDLRRPRVSRYLGMEGAVGLTNVLAGQHKLEDLLVPWSDGLLTVLAAGTTPPDPSEMLGSQHMTELMDELDKRFDFVIIDAPPLLPVTDAAVIAQRADGAVLVVRHGKSRRDELARSVEILRQANARLLGTAITFTPANRDAYGYGYGYGQNESKPAGRRRA